MPKDSVEFRDRVLEWISQMSEFEFVSFFQEAAKVQRNQHSDEEEARFLLADASDPEHLALIGGYDQEVYPDGFASDAPLCQFGTCPDCGCDILSVAKSARCPVCHGKVYCS